MDGLCVYIYITVYNTCFIHTTIVVVYTIYTHTIVYGIYNNIHIPTYTFGSVYLEILTDESPKHPSFSIGEKNPPKSNQITT